MKYFIYNAILALALFATIPNRFVLIAMLPCILFTVFLLEKKDQKGIQNDI